MRKKYFSKQLVALGLPFLLLTHPILVNAQESMAEEVGQENNTEVEVIDEILEEESLNEERSSETKSGTEWNGNTFLDRNYKVCL